MKPMNMTSSFLKPVVTDVNVAIDCSKWEIQRLHGVRYDTHILFTHFD
jgi:hypothetical protein